MMQEAWSFRRAIKPDPLRGIDVRPRRNRRDDPRIGSGSSISSECRECPGPPRGPSCRSAPRPRAAPTRGGSVPPPEYLRGRRESAWFRMIFSCRLEFADAMQREPGDVQNGTSKSIAQPASPNRHRTTCASPIHARARIGMDVKPGRGRTDRVIGPSARSSGLWRPRRRVGGSEQQAGRHRRGGETDDEEGSGR